jgi:hypothetical protein
MVPHIYAAGGGFPGAILRMPAAHMHPLCKAQRTCSLWAEQSAQIGRQRPLSARVASERLDARLPSGCAHGRLIPVCELCQREAAGARLVHVVKLASMRLRELRGGMRRIGETCTAAQTRMSCKDVATQEYDRNGGGIRRRRRVPVGMASFASQRPIARVAASGSAKFRLLTCDRGCHHAISAEYARFPQPRERQAPITQLATKHRDPRQDRRQPGSETLQKGCYDIVTLG